MISYPNIKKQAQGLHQSSSTFKVWNMTLSSYTKPAEIQKSFQFNSIQFKTSVISAIFSKIINLAQFMNLQNENLNKGYQDCNAKNQYSGRVVQLKMCIDYQKLHKTGNFQEIASNLIAEGRQLS